MVSRISGIGGQQGYGVTLKKREIRTVQHKDSGEKTELKKARELRAENQKLKRQISRMRRELAKPPVVVVDDESIEDVVDIKPKNSCPECSSGELRIVKLGSKTLVVCPDCKYRKMQ